MWNKANLWTELTPLSRCLYNDIYSRGSMLEYAAVNKSKSGTFHIKKSSTFLFKWPKRRTNYQNLFCYKTLHVSDIFSAHHQEFSTVHSALVIFMQVFDDRFQAQSGWKCMAVLSGLCLEAVIKNLHENYQCRMYSRKLLMMGREDARNM